MWRQLSVKFPSNIAAVQMESQVKSICICIDALYKTEVLFTTVSLNIVKSGTLHRFVHLMEIDFAQKEQQLEYWFQMSFYVYS